jgi:hypothetical protein
LLTLHTAMTDRCVHGHNHTKHSWPRWPSRCMKMMRRSADERLRTAADCLSRLRGLRPDPMSILRERYNIGDKPEALI